MAKYFIISMLLLFQLLSFSQETKLSEAIVSIAEELAADDSNPEAVSAFIEKLNELAENPVKLNSSGEAEISRLFFLSDFQVKALVDYAHASGRILSVYELVNIPGFDKETVELMIPFITLDYKTNINTDSVKWRNTSVTNLSIRSGIDDTTSSGSPWRILTKYKFTASGLSGGFTTEKDPGEKYFIGNPPLPDFLSAYISYNGNGLIRRIVVGDYSARFGLGTNINTGIRTGLSLSAPGYMSSRDEIKPYTSTDENNFFRGAAAEFSVKNLGINLLYSNNFCDATLGSSSGLSNDIIENFYLAGIHNTPSLLLKKDAVSDLVYGINLSYNFTNSRFGFTWSGEKFSLPVKTAGNDPADIFNFEGNRNNLYTISYNALIKRILLYGELSINENKKFAFVQGFSFRPSDRLIINFLFRNYKAGYVAFHGNGLGSSSNRGNEQGITGNFNFEAAKHLFISWGCDIRQFEWLKYRCSAPSQGMRQELRVRFLPSEKLTFDASYNYRFSMVDSIGTPGIPEQKRLITKSLKGSVRYSINENLTLITRIDYKIFNPSGSDGFLLLQDVNFRFRSIPLSFWLRYCIFNTYDYESRIYTWENDLLYSFSIPALSGKGNRTYLMTSWKISDKTELRLKYGFTSLIESGISTKDTEELKVQIKVQF
ncbi:MAG: helix-hairpin-helix domain-containing protein [Bacteroidetes bacterium]|nr:MAG: helix-hairpin-helix domain-containing protein [Bacteroidota bacterium]